MLPEKEAAMPRGGPRNRAGPQPDPNSARAERRAPLVALPAEGYTGKPPAWPLPEPTARERTVWAQVWKTPQAAAWAVQPWRWRTIGLYVRWTVRMEDPEAGAAVAALAVRLADQVGMTPAGLKENGWKIASDEVGERKAARRAAKPATSVRDRLKVVGGDERGG